MEDRSEYRFLNKEDVLSLTFKEGEAFFRIVRTGVTTLKDDGTAARFGYLADVAPDAASGWVQIQNAASRNMLVPKDDHEIWHVGWGVTPNIAEIYRQYPPGKDRNSLLDPILADGVYGMVQGYDAPYQEINLDHTEFFTMKSDLHPAFKARIPATAGIAADSFAVKMRFVIHKYEVEYLRQTTQAQRDRAYYREIGDIDELQGMTNWVRDLYGNR